MYGSKRLAKRSIIGTRVCAPWPDGIYYPGWIRNVENRAFYTICFDDGYTKVFREGDIVGQGFRAVSSVHLKFGQKVFVTNNGREMVGHVQKHKKPTNEVFIKIADSSEMVIQRKLDEVRLMESRKSARLADHETNYLKMADMSPNSDAKKRNVSSSIDVPSAKALKVEEEPLMNDVMAAMVLTSLSGSPLLTRMDSTSVPYSPTSPPGGATSDLSTGTAFPYSPSSSGHFSWDFLSRGTPSPTSSTSDVEFNMPGFPYPEIGSTNGVNFDQMSLDEGIDMSEVGALCTVNGIPAKKLKLAPTRTVYKCTWPGCGKTLCKVQGIEKHIRSQHLRTKDPSSNYNDHEEEFYYTETETTVDSMSDMFADMNTSSPPPTLSHMDMVRPPHEDPQDTNGNHKTCLDREAAQVTPLRSNGVTTVAPLSKVLQQTTFTWQTTHPTTFTPFQTIGQQYSSPIRTKTSIVQQRQQIHQAASPKTHLHFSLSAGSGSANSQGHHHHHHPKTREGKKCRKVYGMERKDLWCTQCRWKKACVRFTC